MKRCPFCAEEIQDAAIVCRYCNRDLAPAAPPDDGRPVFSLTGRGCGMEVFNDKVTITPRGFIGLTQRGLKGTKTIPFRSITALQHKRAGLTVGFLQFSVSGYSESKGGAYAAMRDENTFTYGSASDNDVVGKVKTFVEARLHGRVPAAASPGPTPKVRGGIVVDEGF